MSQQTQDRRWVVNLLVDEYGDPLHRQFEEDVQQAMAESGAILLRLGGSIRSYVIRQEDESGLWHPVQAVFTWQSFVPGIRAPRPAPAPEPAVELEPESDMSAAYEQAQAELVEEQLADDVLEPDEAAV